MPINPDSVVPAVHGPAAGAAPAEGSAAGQEPARADAEGPVPAPAGRAIPLTTPGGIDRASGYRLDEAWLGAAWSHPTTRVFVVSGGQALVEDTADGRTELVMTPSFDAPVTEAHRYFLGTDDAGVRYFAVQKDSLPGRMDDAARPAGLREAAALLDERDAALLVHAVALENWQRMHRFCSRCGERTVIAAAGHIRRCPACGGEHYPRTDPAVIMLVTDEEDRALLGRQMHWPEGRFSTLAGFVEPGESVEQAVAREVAEEVGVVVDRAEYLASQPWPFPSALMLGFRATAVPGRTAIAVDGEEISEARWFSRDDLRAAIESGEIHPPSGISIAARLVELWYGKPLPTP